MNPRHPIALYAIVSIAAVLVCAASGHREVWDDPRYFPLLYPGTVVLVFSLGLLIPATAPVTSPLILGMLPVSWHLAVMVANNPGGGNLWPLTVVAWLALSIPPVAAAYAGVGVRRLLVRLHQSRG